MGVKGKDSITSTSSSSKPIETQNDKEIIELFHIRVISKHNKVDTFFNTISQANLISEAIVKKLKLETIPHPKPYPLGWVCDNAKLQVTRKCKLKFAITANFIDEVDLDVVPLDISSIFFGSSYSYDKKTIFYRHEKNIICLKMELIILLEHTVRR